MKIRRKIWLLSMLTAALLVVLFTAAAWHKIRKSLPPHRVPMCGLST